MTVQICANGRLEFIVGEPKNTVEEAAMKLLLEALEKGQQVSVVFYAKNAVSISVEV